VLIQKKKSNIPQCTS